MSKIGWRNFLVWEHLPGTQTLGWHLSAARDGTALPALAEALGVGERELPRKLLSELLSALALVHKSGVVHRDIKPENILIDRKGRLKITDFGLAKLLGKDDGPTGLTMAHQVMGTPHYMAPEQVEHPLDVDHRADFYSLGVVFYGRAAYQRAHEHRFSFQTVGFFDGQIHVSSPGEPGDSLRVLLYHEYAHALFREQTGGDRPYWLNEGLAELIEREFGGFVPPKAFDD